jgi:hypothetical protein
MDVTARPAGGKSGVTLRIVMRAALMLSVLTVVACASPGVPPGGPVDTEAPEIVRIAPDSGQTGTRPRDVIFRFNEVVSERPAGAQSLGALFLISPRDGEPRVDWSREEVAVRPRRGWRANTAYTVTMLPGISDLRGNVRNTGAVTTFATGATFPTGRITGTLFNWAEGRVMTRGLVEARPRSDTTLAYVASTDSAGGYVIANVPPGSYVVRGIGDDNNNRGLDPREPWDSAAVTLGETSAVDLYAFVHDSTGTRLQNISVVDSVTIRLSFDNPLSIAQPLTPANVQVRAPDSTAVPIVSVTLPPPDTTAAARSLKRPVPSRAVTVRLGRPLRVSTSYRVRVTGVQNLMGVARNSESLLAVPATFPPAANPPAAVPAASTAPPAPVKR